MNATTTKVRATVTETNVLYAWYVPQTDEWVLAEHHRIAQWNKLGIKWVKVVRQWDKRLTGEFSDRITQTITGQWAVEYVQVNLPVCRLLALTQIGDDVTMIVEWSF